MRLFWLSLRTGLLELKAHKTRSFLSLLSVAIGAGVFLSSFASIYQANYRVRKSLELSGEGRFSLTPSYSRNDKEKSVVLTLLDLQAISKAMPWLYMIYPMDRTWFDAVFEDGSKVDMSFLGVTTQWRKRDWQYKLEGRFFNEYDVENAAKVCLLVLPGAMKAEERAMRKAYEKNWKWWSGLDKYVARNTVRIGSKVKVGRYELTVI
ncbi:MAG TPA: ABC transporter permease, partial [Elusimicrobiales bacterium]|nr:ABC transporter permease [Elusimicrobiales bacterium]